MAERFRALLLAPVLVCLAAGLYGGLTRMGVFKPFFQQPMLHHGGLMVVGFLASLIALERYFGGGSWVAALSSLCFSLGGVALLFSGMVVNKVLWAAGSVSFLSWAFLNQHRFRTHFSTIFFTASAAFIGVGIYFYIQNSPTTFYSYAYTAFLTTFIVGERMDMLKISNAPRTAYILAAASIPLAAVAILTAEKLLMATAFTIVLLTAARRDVALRFVRKKGFSRYLGLGLATAYSWLGLAAVLWLYTNSFDTLIHVIFLGFAATMIFTHAPIILPAILRIPHFYSPHLYIPFTILQTSTVLRLSAGTAYNLALWSLSGWMTVISVLTFAVVALTNVLSSKRLI
jgi:hypothetical protein